MNLLEFTLIVHAPSPDGVKVALYDVPPPDSVPIEPLVHITSPNSKFVVLSLDVNVKSIVKALKSGQIEIMF